MLHRSWTEAMQYKSKTPPPLLWTSVLWPQALFNKVFERQLCVSTVHLEFFWGQGNSSGVLQLEWLGLSNKSPASELTSHGKWNIPQLMSPAWSIDPTQTSHPLTSQEIGSNASHLTMMLANRTSKCAPAGMKVHTAGIIIAINDTLSGCNSACIQKQQAKPQTSEN